MNCTGRIRLTAILAGLAGAGLCNCAAARLATSR